MTLKKKTAMTPEEAMARALEYRYGRGVRRNTLRAKQLMEVAANGGIPEAMCALGNMILSHPRNADDRKRGLGWLELAHKGGVFSAAFNLGRAAENVGDWAKAEKWYRRAIDQGDFISGDRLAWHYLDQMDTRYHKEGVAILRRTVAKSRWAQADFPGVTIELAKCYLHGKGVRKSIPTAKRLLAQVADTDVDARKILRDLQTGKKRQ